MPPGDEEVDERLGDDVAAVPGADEVVGLLRVLLGRTSHRRASARATGARVGGGVAVRLGADRSAPRPGAGSGARLGRRGGGGAGRRGVFRLLRPSWAFFVLLGFVGVRRAERRCDDAVEFSRGIRERTADGTTIAT